MLNDDLKNLVYQSISDAASLDTFSHTELDPLHWCSPEGKMLRSAIVYAVAGNHTDPAVTDCAAAVHLIHSASLILDDIHDSDTVRHLKPSCWVITGTNQAMNLGNFLFTSALKLLMNTQTDAQTRLSLVSKAVECIGHMIEGQMMDLHFSDSNRSSDYYMRCIRGKTGALFGLSYILPAILMGVEPTIRKTATEHFTDLGSAYQLSDDIIDMEGRKETRQKNSDILRGRCTIASCVPFVNEGLPTVINFMDEYLRTINQKALELPVIVQELSSEFNAMFLNRSSDRFYKL